MNDAELRRWAVEQSVKVFAHQEDATPFKILAYAELIKRYVETGQRPR